MNKDNILQQVTPIDIFTAFLQIDKIPKGNISSPFTDDKNPSFKLYPKTNSFKCFATGKQGDCFQFVADLNNLDCKREFSSVTALIAEKLNIEIQDNSIEFHKIEFSEKHIGYYKQGNWNITKELLQKYNVNAIDKFSFFNSKKNQRQEITISPDRTGIVYDLGKESEIYIPASGNLKKFFLNKQKGETIFGINQLPEKPSFIIIAAGKKDCLILNANGFPSVCFRSENHYITKNQAELLKGKSENVLICYDNDAAGIAACNRAVKDYKFTAVSLPKNTNDVADFFFKNDAKVFGDRITEVLNSIKLKAEKRKDSIFDKAEQYLEDRYEFRYNTVSLAFESRKKGEFEFEETNENNLYIELNKNGINITQNKLIAILKSDFVPHYNPLIEYFEELPAWDKKTDHINKLASYVNTFDNEQFAYHFKKWCVRAVKCVFDQDYFNKQAFILVHKGQSSGKSTWCRFLCPPPLKNYIAEDIKGNDKDDRILICKNFIINLDELSALSKTDINALKAFFSKTFINERLPYDKKNTLLSRVCSFVGSTNMGEFLNDETGSVRWLCFELSGQINFDYKKHIDINLVWSQALELSRTGFQCELTLEDIKRNEERNEKFANRTIEQELIDSYLEKPSEKNKGQFQTPTDIMIQLRQKYERLNSPERIGKALVKNGFDKVKKSRYGYYVVYKDLIPIK